MQRHRLYVCKFFCLTCGFIITEEDHSVPPPPPPRKNALEEVITAIDKNNEHERANQEATVESG
ncbi:hypothetical protein GUITHDRAFT_151099 [Guillardia theta CCMP2712]|uniref:Uncharacterized protein n=1 Tax=Guillardia theta (strain CCMP2712) TaxID=905079 RepID=L1JR12_GUITC|nr:hypothetical protein GUITHDRAFT_151099 [Guillardia theta CCMP2712]EKX50872.1 hypothetical protein GUITHDRAFT_151099 [Guillardia theta CCMP2712]|eukprot:XP_005837852.1 hypothetical protein GUITHDRAFT_151099 [Guillardia theta CCMP2712]